MKTVAEKFDIAGDVLQAWQSEAFFLEYIVGKKRKRRKTLVILVHGWSLSPKQARPLAEKLNNKGYAVSVPRLSGHGTKPEDLMKTSFADWVEDVVAEIWKYEKDKRFDKIILGGFSMGGNACLLASLREKVDGIFLVGTPVHFKNHLVLKVSSMILPFFIKYTKKIRPKNIYYDEADSYQYVPSKNMREVLKLVKKSINSLKKVTSPVLILQTRNDFFVTKESPWIIYRNLGSKTKEMHWIHTDSENHVPQGVEVQKTVEEVDKFIKRLEKK
jgi:carboxylesterase